MRKLVNIISAKVFAISVLVVSLSGCSLLRESTSNGDIEIPARFTYSWLDQPASAYKSLTGSQRAQIRSGVDEALKERGASVSDRNEAMYLVAIHYSSASELTPIDILDGYGVSVSRTEFSDSNGLFLDGIDKNRLAIDLIDARSMEVVWRGNTLWRANRFQMDRSAKLIAESIPNKECTIPGCPHRKFAGLFK